jgi:ABC-type multidrug transport system fused ATPase/permease subunit
MTGWLQNWAPSALARATWRAHRPLAVAWWGLVGVRSLLPGGLTLGLGALVSAIAGGRSVTGPLLLVGGAFALLSMSSPIHTQVSSILGEKTSGWLQSSLTAACADPHGISHLERPGLSDELTMGRDFDLGITGPPMSVALGFISAGMVELGGGVTQTVVLGTVLWWAPLVIGAAWLSTHWLLRESSVWANRTDPEVMAEQRHADYAYRLAVEAQPAKELRVFGLGEWTVERFNSRRRRLVDLQWKAMRLRQRPLLTVFAVLGVAHAVVLVPLISSAVDGDLPLASVVVAAQALLGASALAVGGFAWALEGAAQPVLVVERLGKRMAEEGALDTSASTEPADGLPREAIRFEDVGFTYPSGGAPVYEHLDLTIPAGKSLAIVGRNGVGKTTLVKLLCRLYDPTSGAITVDGRDLRTFDVDAWRRRVSVVFQDFVRFELSLRRNIVLDGASIEDADLEHLLEVAGASGLAQLDQPLSKAQPGGTDLSGGQWQRVALARALASVRLGAGVIILDEPTAQLDVRGEAAIFERLLAATAGRTTILISHRFSTVRHADRIVVIEDGLVVEQGSHDELMAADGRYRAMFDLQASRFSDDEIPDLDDVELLEEELEEIEGSEVAR